jgi:hypothetical protein
MVRLEAGAVNANRLVIELARRPREADLEGLLRY